MYVRTEPVNESVLATLAVPKMLEGNTIWIPPVGGESKIYLKASALHCEQNYIITITRYDPGMNTESYWDFGIRIENGTSCFRIDYGKNLEKHHFEDAHIHMSSAIEPGKEMALHLQESEIEEFFPFIVIPRYLRDEYIDNENPDVIIEDIQEAIDGFLMTCGVYDLTGCSYDYTDA